MSDTSLVTVLDEVRGKTLSLLEGVSDTQAHWSPPGLQNTILWHAGHSYVLLEHLTMHPLSRDPVYPDGWFELFSWESRPAHIAADRWPHLDAVVESLKAQYQRLRPIVSALTHDELARTLGDGSGRPVRYCILHALHDEACHSGEIWLLRKMTNAL